MEKPNVATRRKRAAILDLDGTLVDTNYHHAIAWFRAFRAFDAVSYTHLTLPTICSV